MTVVCRFAPSPTGYLHIGGARTALFNWLFARRHGGRFLLRIEDTDRERSTEAAVGQITESLAWLRLDHDGEVVRQSTRESRHREVAEQLLAEGKAYLAFDTPQELEAMRAKATAEKRPPRYDGTWRDRDPATAPPGSKGAIRIKAPREGESVVEDLVQGAVRVPNAELDDMIILRSDGTPTYLHAVVVDDHDMGITHVIRGDDHLTNSFRQLMVYRGMGWAPPAFAHIPLIHGEDGAKLSKRHGAVGVLEFRDQGYLPEAVANYLLRLGWGRGDIELIPIAEAVQLFDLADVGRSASRFDYRKLAHVNGVYLRAADNDRVLGETVARLARRGVAVSVVAMGRITALIQGLKERASTFEEVADAAMFLTTDGSVPAMEPKAHAMLTLDARTMLAAWRDLVAGGEWTAPALEAATRGFAAARGVKLAAVAQPVRAAVTGSLASPPLFDVLAALGREETVARLDSA
ncbi:MAG: glutamate--tRNA ligase [Acetobacteraceae bacterium]|nr:glutamate--tRNA ligase [Acetobacteraceae bacterium]